MSDTPHDLHALMSAREKTGIGDCTIVTWDDEAEVDGIRVAKSWSWKSSPTAQNPLTIANNLSAFGLTFHNCFGSIYMV